MSPPQKPAHKRAVSRFIRDPLRRLRKGALLTLARIRLRTMAQTAGYLDRGKLVSVLLPSRGRPLMLKETVANLVGKSEDPARIEILIRLDDDDEKSRKAAPALLAEYGEAIKILTGPRGRGYAGMHHFINELCAEARGDFLFLFNDDARMETENWCRELVALRDQICVLKPRTNYTAENPFPIVHRKIRDIIGHFAAGPYCDKWAEVISQAAGIEKEPDIFVTHEYHEAGNLTNLNTDQTATEVNRAESRRQQYKWRTRLQLDIDTARVIAHLERHGEKLNRQKENQTPPGKAR
jgi:hypothetical protein